MEAKDAKQKNTHAQGAVCAGPSTPDYLELEFGYCSRCAGAVTASARTTINNHVHFTE